MCEIQIVYGLNKRIEEKDLVLFKELMKKGNETNSDSAGFLQLDKTSVLWFKTKKLNTLFKEIELNQTRCLIGHNRLKTSGTIENKDNHPFHYKNLYWLHNGMLWNDTELYRKYHLGNDKIETDSYIIGKLVNHFLTRKKKRLGIVKAITKALGEIEGSYSVIFYDIKTQRLFYAKNSSTSFVFELWRDTKTKKYLIVGTTDKNNLTTLNSNLDKWGFPINQKYLLVSKIEPDEDRLYEITEGGIKKIKGIKIKDNSYRYGYAKYYNNDDDDDMYYLSEEEKRAQEEDDKYYADEDKKLQTEINTFDNNEEFEEYRKEELKKEGI